MSTKPPPYGPDNPHPLSKMSTELVWEGKYDEYGNRRQIKTAELAMPMQHIESIDEPRSRAEGQSILFQPEKKHRDSFRNRLVWGDNKLVLASLREEFKGKIDLIYIDPPFAVGQDFRMQLPYNEGKSLQKEQSLMEMVAYRDMWGEKNKHYLHFMYERLILMWGLLSERGSIYVHCDWRVNAYLRLVLDQVFGPGLAISQKTPGFSNDITWRRQIVRGMKTHAKYFPFNADSIFLYRKSENAIWNNIKNEILISLDEARRRYFEDEKGFFSTSEKGSYTDESIIKLDKEGRIYITNGGSLNIKRDGTVSTTKGKIRVKYYKEQRGNQVVEEKISDNIWDDIPGMAMATQEYVSYPTQKPKSLLKRIIEASSNPDSIVADFFCGSGTTGAVAEELGRRWIMSDLGRFAIHTSRKRLLQVQRELDTDNKRYRAFDVYNLGRYERQWWQKERLSGDEAKHRELVLKFYRAQPLQSPLHPMLHGRKNGALCHVAPMDTVFGRSEATQAAQAAEAAGAKALHCLAWDFEMGLGEALQALQVENGVDLRQVQIPREVMETNRENAVFMEAASLAAKAIITRQEGKKWVDVRLLHFWPSLAEAPEKELEKLRAAAQDSGFDFIDFWAVDFDWSEGKPFQHCWQDFRTRRKPTLHKNTEKQPQSNAGFVYNAPGQYTICVKVVDMFGCETTATTEVSV